MKDKKTFGAFIKEKRINKNYSQKDLAELLYVTESAVSKWERGVSYPDITLITDLCNVLEISERELIQSSDDYEYRKMKRNSDKYNKIKKVLFWTFNICYSTALVVCFIVNLAVNKTLSWFFIVLASIIVAYTFCPTITWINNKYKKHIFIGSTFIALFILFLTCSIFTKNYWFMIPTIGVLLGYFIVFYPILFLDFKKLNEEKYNKISKGFLLIYSIIILVLILFLLVTIYCYKPFNILLGIVISIGCMSIPIIFGILNLFNKNKHIMKIVSLSLAGLALIFVILGLVKTIQLKSTEQTENYVIEEVYNQIDIDVDTEDINIYFSKDETKIISVENEKISYDVKVVGEILIIRKIDDRKFYEKLFSWKSKIDLYLSEEIINSLEINCDTGDININKGFTFNDIEIINSTGEIKLESNVTNQINMKNSTGDIDIKNCDNLGDINIETSTGDIEIININCKSLEVNIATGRTKLKDVIVVNNFKMIGSTGDLLLDGFDAANINVELSTGSVKGTLLTSKFFIVKSDTGRVIVPETREGGDCRITVDTGDIIIEYK